jgi:hypothetical protein
MKTIVIALALLWMLIPTQVFASASEGGVIHVTMFQDLNKNGVQDNQEPSQIGMVDVEFLTDPEATIVELSVYQDGNAHLSVPIGTYEVCIRPHDNQIWKVTGLNSLCQVVTISENTGTVPLNFGIQVIPEIYQTFVPMAIAP